MNVLGNAGSIYMVVLIFLLIVGLGLIIKGLFHMIIGNSQKKPKQSGGGFMQNQSISWLKLAMISFIGIIIGLMLLSFMAPYGTNGISMGMGYGGDSMMNSSTGNMASHTGSNTMGSMSHSGSSTNGLGSTNTPMIQSGGSANYNNMMQTLNQMQWQINQMQQQMMLNWGNYQVQNVPQNGTNSGGAMTGGASGGSTGGSGGGMM